MILNDVNLAAAREVNQALFYESLRAVPPLWPNFCTRMQITGSQCTHHHLAELGMPRQWLGPREITQLRAESVTIVDVEWEKSVGVLRKELEDDDLGIIKPRIMNLAQTMISFQDKRAIDRLILGFTAINGHDGVTFFASTHPRDGGLANQNNTANSALSDANFNAAYASMASLTDRAGVPLGLLPRLLMTGPHWRATAKSIVEVEYLASGASNPNYKTVEYLMNPWITGHHWFLFAEVAGMKAWLQQFRTEVEFEAQDTALSDNLFMNGELRYGARQRFESGPALWYLAYGNLGA